MQGLVQMTNLSYQGTFPKHPILIKTFKFSFFIFTFIRLIVANNGKSKQAGAELCQAQASKS